MSETPNYTVVIIYMKEKVQDELKALFVSPHKVC